MKITYILEESINANPFNELTSDISIENFNISNIRKVLYKLFNSVVGFIKKIYNWIRNKVTKLFKLLSNTFRKNKTKLDLINKIIEVKGGVLPDSSINKITDMINSVSEDISTEDIPNFVTHDQVDELIRFFKGVSFEFYRIVI